MKNYFISKEQFESNNFANVVFHYEDCDFETIVALKPMEELGITENDNDDEKIGFYFIDWDDWCYIIDNGIDDMVIKEVKKVW